MATEDDAPAEGSRARAQRYAPGPLDAATALWDESAGVLRGGVGQVLGLTGDINEAAARYITPKLPRSLRSVLERAPAAPTTEDVLGALPTAKPEGMSAARQHSVDVGEFIGRNAPLPGEAYAAPFRAVPKTLRAVDKVVAADIGKQGKSAQRGIFLLPTTPAEKDAQKLAEEYEKLNVDPKEIHELTGLHRAEDGKWRVELDDSKAYYRAPDIIDKRMLADPDMARQDSLIETRQIRDFLDRGLSLNQIEREYRLMGKPLRPEIVKAAQKRTGEDLDQHINQVHDNIQRRAYGKPIRLEDAIDHPELFSRVPELRDLEVSIKDTGQYGGWYSPGQPGSIALSKGARDPRSGGSVLLHETEHAIQHKQALDPGISPETIKDSYKRQADAIQRSIDDAVAAGGPFNDALAREYKKMLDDMGPMDDKIAMEQYLSNMGEKEAREVQARMNMSEADRRKSFPRTISSATSEPGRSVSELTFGQHGPGKGYSMSNAPAAEDAGDLAYHAGDLGYGLDTTLGRMEPGRSTGHFGTGTYFTSSKERSLPAGDSTRPVSEVDLSGYNLARPKSEDDAKYLHDGLRDVNDLVGSRKLDNPKTQEEIRKAAFNIWISILPRGKTPQDIEKMIPEVLAKSSSAKNSHSNAYAESASTLLMRRLGYEGVDTRHIPGYDNRHYGTVVYGEKFAPGLKDKVGGK